MRRLIIVCGQTGAGKTSYSIKISKQINAVRFSIDPWMQTLFAKDMQSLEFSWMMERIERCQKLIWEVSEQILRNNGDVVLDLGFTTKAQRSTFIDHAKKLGITAEVHYLEAPSDVRRQRIAKRNSEKDPQVYSFKVTDEMFEFMEPRFAVPDNIELQNGLKIDVGADTSQNA